MSRRSFLVDQRGAAAVEMALLVPLLIVLLFGGFEAGNFVWTQHKLVEAVRDGARFAGRLNIDEVCRAGGMSGETQTMIKLLTRTGQVADPDTDDNCAGSGGPKPKVCGWSDAQVEVTCTRDVTLNKGIYSDYNFGEEKGPVITVEAKDVQYHSLFNGLGILDSGDWLKLSAKSHGPVIGL